MVGVEPDQIGPMAGRQAADPAPERLGAAGQRRLPEPGAAVRLLDAARDQAAERVEPLTILEPAQLLDRADRDMAVGADPEPAARVEEGRELEQAVAEVGRGGRAQARERAGAGE